MYIHNLSGFDGMFILKTLAAIEDKFNIIIKDDKIISVTVQRNKVNLIFQDSLLLLPASLSKLGKGFGVAWKGDFDHTRSDKCTTREQFEQIREELLAYNKQCQLALPSTIPSFKQILSANL